MAAVATKGPQRVPLAAEAPAAAKVRAILRVRPLLVREAGAARGAGRPAASAPAIDVDGASGAARIVNPRNSAELLAYQFDSCYAEDATQMRIFAQDVVPVVQRALAGYNATIFAYGNTGAGKTFTMEGTAAAPGMIPLSVQYVLEAATRATARVSAVHVSYLEIYKEKVYDLLATHPAAADLPIREDASRRILVPDLTAVRVASLADFERVWTAGVRNRSTAATSLNAHSSRSHSCLTVQIAGAAGCAKLHLIDLAGSEDNRRTANTGQRLVESGAINRSLFVLGQVVDALNASAARIPYRDSKLTRLLQDSLGGSAYALLIANVAPTDPFLFDTYNTLNFAARARLVENNVARVQRDSGSAGGKRFKASSCISTSLTSSSPATLSSAELVVRKRPVAGCAADKENPFDRSQPGSLQSIVLERRIEEKVAEKLREISRGTILSPLLRGGASRLALGRAGESSPLAKAVRSIKQHLPRARAAKKPDEADPQAAQLLPLVEPSLLLLFNQGTVREIKGVREIGAKRAQAIVEHRAASGALPALASLVGAGIISQKTLDKIVLAHAHAIGRVAIVPVLHRPRTDTAPRHNLIIDSEDYP